MSCICEARHNSESYPQHSLACQEQSRRALGDATGYPATRGEAGGSDVTQNAGTATPYNCPDCDKRFDLRERDGGLFVPIHAHMTEGGMCKQSGTQVFLGIDLVDLTPQPPPPFLPEANALCPPKPVPPDVVFAAQRLDQNLVDARDGGYYNHGWGGYMDRAYVERLISYVLAQPRSTT